MDKREMAMRAWFQKINSIGAKTLFRLREHYGTLEAAYGAAEGELCSMLTGRQYGAIRAAKYAGTPEAYLEKITEQGIRYISFDDDIYPERLRYIPDPPFGLFVKGILPVEYRASVAMIGARACSEYGKAVAREFAAELAGYGVQIVSGMARGIDAISQQACVRAGGRTFSVLGSGVDICYPEELEGLYGEICGQGGILSEYAPGTPPMSANFPPRNRIISGLSDVVLVIEARQKSGTLITVDMALEQGREVAVIPGRITDSLSKGCYELLKQGATLIYEPEQLVALLREIGQLQKHHMEIPEAVHKKHRERADITSEGTNDFQKSILNCLVEEPQYPEKIYGKWLESGEKGQFKEFLEGLMDLELMDLCKSSKNQFSIR